MRGRIVICIGSLIVVALGSAFAEPTTVPTTQKWTSIRPTRTPREAQVRSMQAMLDGDESAFRDIVDVRSPRGYSEAYTRWVFAATRLEKAVREHNVVGRRIRQAGFDRNEKLSTGVTLPSTEEWDVQRRMMEAVEWEVNGEMAHPRGQPSISSRSEGQTWVERSGDGWIVVISDPEKLSPPDYLANFVLAWSIKAGAFNEAAEKVRANKLRTVLEVNDFIDAQVAKAVSTE